MRTLAVALILVLAGCGGGSAAKEPAPAKTSATAPTTTTKPTVAPPTGEPAPEALSRFRCAAGPKGVWRAAGYIANSSKSARTFQVTVYVGEAAGGDEKGRTKQLPNVAADGSTRFVIDKIPAAKTGGPCHVQVLATK